jgi:hypothetical protein
MWVGTYFQRNAEQVMRRVEETLRLIKTYDERRYKRLISDLSRVWVRLVPGGLGKYTHSLRACELDERFVLAETSPPEMIAATIVHEATHARLWRFGFGYDENVRGRVEAVCVRRELANRPADPAIGSGDHGFLAGEAPRSPAGMFAMVRDRLHLGREARHGLLLLGEGRFGSVHHCLTFGICVVEGKAGLASLFRTEAEFKLDKIRALIHPSPAGMGRPDPNDLWEK